jgi:hypothetical protein
MLVELCGCMVETTCLYCVTLVEPFCFYCVALWLRHPVSIVWLYGWDILFVLYGCMGEILFLLCGCMVEASCFCLWLYGWGICFYCVAECPSQLKSCPVTGFYFYVRHPQVSTGEALYSGLCFFLHRFQLPIHYSLSCFSFDVRNFLSWCHVGQGHRTGSEGLHKYCLRILFLYPNFMWHCRCVLLFFVPHTSTFYKNVYMLLMRSYDVIIGHKM